MINVLRVHILIHKEGQTVAFSSHSYYNSMDFYYALEAHEAEQLVLE